MSWDIFVQDIPASAKSISEIPDDFEPQPIGRRANVIAAIEELVPYADFTDPAWGRIDALDFSIEVNLGDQEQLDGFAFHVRGGGRAAVVVAEILRRLSLRALDPSAPGGIFESNNDPASGLHHSRDYRDRIVR